MSRPELSTQLTALFLEKLNLEIPSTKQDLIESGLMDSMTLVDLLLHLEQQFDLRISADTLELESFRSIESIAAFIDKQRSSAE